MKKALFGGMLLMAAVLTFTLSSVAADDNLICHIWPQEHYKCEEQAPLRTRINCCVGDEIENDCPGEEMQSYETSGEACCEWCLNSDAGRIADHMGDACCYLE